MIIPGTYNPESRPAVPGAPPVTLPALLAMSNYLLVILASRVEGLYCFGSSAARPKKKGTSQWFADE